VLKLNWYYFLPSPTPPFSHSLCYFVYDTGRKKKTPKKKKKKHKKKKKKKKNKKNKKLLEAFLLHDSQNSINFLKLTYQLSVSIL